MDITVEKWLFWISQGKVATVYRWGGQFSQDLTYQKSFKSVNFWQSYLKNEKVDVFGTQCTWHIGAERTKFMQPQLTETAYSWPMLRPPSKLPLALAVISKGQFDGNLSLGQLKKYTNVQRNITNISTTAAQRWVTN